MRALKVRSLSGRLYEFRVDQDTTVERLRQMVSEKANLEFGNVGLIFDHAELTDEQLVSPIAVAENSFVVFYHKSHSDPPMVEQPQLVQKLEVLPKIDANGKPVPANIGNLMQFMIGLQFTREHAFAALQFANYDLDSAVSLLVHGKASNSEGHDNTGDPASPPPAGRPDDGAEAEGAKTEHNGPTVPIREADTLNVTLDSLPVEQRLAIQRLTSHHHDIGTVLQVYLACDKDETTTLLCLETM